MHVITITGNLLAEWTFETGFNEPGKTHRADAMSFQVGGKGINVSRILLRMQAQTRAIAFAEGPLGKLCEQWINQHGVRVEFFPLQNPVRPGVVIRPSGPAAFPETTFLGADMPVPASSWARAMSKAADQNPDWLAICGSIPGWERQWAKPLEEAILANPDMAVCVDTYGPPLEDLIELPLDLVKVNRKEILGLSANTEYPSVYALLEDLKSKHPVHNWIITDGAEKITTSFELGGSLELTPTPIEEASPTGSGDAFMAAFLSGWRPGEDPSDALSFATACATANAASKGIGDFPIPPPQKLHPKLKNAGAQALDESSD